MSLDAESTMKEFATELFARIPVPLLAWFETHKRDLPWRNTADPYRIWLSEIMLQQTRVEAVKPYFERFITRLPDIAALAAADDETILKLWEGLGYYSRVRNLRNAARIIMKEYDGIFPTDIAAIRALPGIGDYTAGAIASIAFGAGEPAVDGNVLRVATRLAGSRENISRIPVRHRVADVLREVYPPGKASEFTQSLMELGALVCLPNGEPKCEECPLSSFCQSRKYALHSVIPVKNTAKERKKEQRTVLILSCGGKYALQKRPGKGLLASLWEFPALPGWLEIADLPSFCRAPRRGPDAVHVFSHLEWHMISYFSEVPEMLPEYVWFSPEEFPAIPSALKRYVDAISAL
ncbi:MAG: A/G-specific adenine glycosylase [Lentisphaeria bacterium]|nr:A/G-specific adenine glycosylase [Lentisphaeria bacterium]